METSPLMPFRNLPEDLLYWIKHYMVDRFESLDKAGAKSALDVGKLINEVRGAKNIEGITIAANEGNRLGIKGLRIYSNRIKILYDYLVSQKEIMLNEIDDRIVQRYAMDAGKNDLEKRSLYQYAKYFFNFIQSYNVCNDTSRTYKFDIGKGRAGQNSLLSGKSHRRLPYFTLEELKKLDQSTTFYPNYKNLEESVRVVLMVKLFIHTGMSVNELQGLRLEDFAMSDFASAAETNDEVMTVIVGKGKKRRVLPLPKKDISDYLYQHIRQSGCQGIVFCSRRGGIISRQTIAKIISAQLAFAGLDHQAPIESFKNSYAIALSQKGVSEKNIQKLLGHAKLQTTRFILQSAKQDNEKEILPKDAILNF